jgi:hypothetical protein
MISVSKNAFNVDGEEFTQARCLVIFHELIHLKQYLLGVVNGEINPANPIVSDQMLKDFEKEANDHGTRLEKFFGTERNQSVFFRSAYYINARDNFLCTEANRNCEAWEQLCSYVSVSSSSACSILSQVQLDKLQATNRTKQALFKILDNWDKNDPHATTILELRQALEYARRLRLVVTLDSPGPPYKPERLFQIQPPEPLARNGVFYFNQAVFEQLSESDKQSALISAASIWQATETLVRIMESWPLEDDYYLIIGKLRKALASPNYLRIDINHDSTSPTSHEALELDVTLTSKNCSWLKIDPSIVQSMDPCSLNDEIVEIAKSWDLYLTRVSQEPINR